MRRISILAGLGVAVAMSASLVHAQEIETFDSPNELQTNGGNYQQTNDSGSWESRNDPTITYGSTYYEISATGYGSGYHSIYADDKPPAGSGLSNGVVNIGSSNALALDVSINNGTTAGLIVDLQDGEGDYITYDFGYGLTGNPAVDSLNGTLLPGETVTAGRNGNDEVLTVPYADASYANDPNTPNTFDYTALVLFRLENDPGGAASDVSYYDLSAVSVPEPASLSILAIGGLLAGRRRR